MTYRINGQAVTKEVWDARPSKMDWSKCNSPRIHVVQPFVSPIDGKVISSKKGLRDHEKEHKVIQVGDEYIKLVETKKEEAHERKFESNRDAERDRRNFNWH